ncbi:MAG: hypothetical protein ACK4ZD_13040 [Caldimonas sp.]|uniref:hypothetical protein n=1 Tax=Caldimonas sp. TaxID=2838790 RepID=UPI00391C5D29
MRAFPLILALLTSAALSGCDQLGIESAQAVAERREAEGRALGGACRHAGRAIEDCYTLNPKADKAAIFAGWREMNDYMAENKLTEVPPQVVNPRHAKLLNPAPAETTER